MPTPLTWIRSFEAAARLGSFTSAASEIGLTQAAVSQQIKALESHLGAQLFRREARGVSLTGAGTELYLDMSHGLDRMDSALARFARREADDLWVFCNTSLSVRWLVPHLPDFIATNPDFAVHLRVAPWRKDTLGLRADVELFLTPGIISSTATLLPGGAMVAVASPTWATELRGNAGPGSARVISVTAYNSLFESWIAMSSVRRIAPASLEVDTFHAALILAEAGAGITICPRLLAIESLRSGTLVELDAPPEGPTLSYSCVVQPKPTRPATVFRDWIVESLCPFRDVVE